MYIVVTCPWHQNEQKQRKNGGKDIICVFD